jgi:hypothetical protein
MGTDRHLTILEVLELDIDAALLWTSERETFFSGCMSSNKSVVFGTIRRQISC